MIMTIRLHKLPFARDNLPKLAVPRPEQVVDGALTQRIPLTTQ